MSGNDLHIEPILAVSGIEFLVVLVIMAISALYNWVQKKKKGKDEWGDFNQPPVAPKPGSQTSWEDELRRMLEGDAPTAPPQQNPPVIRQQPPVPRPTPPAPKPAPRAQPPVAPQRAPVHSKTVYRGHCDQCEGHLEFPSDMMGSDIRCPHCYQVTKLYPHTETVIERRTHKAQIAATRPVPGFEKPQPFQQQARAPYSPASKPAVPADPGQRRQSPEIKEVVSLLSNPRTARQAIIASIILTPPKALE